MIQLLSIILALFAQDESLLEKFEKEVERVVIKGRPSLVSITAHIVINGHPRFEEHDDVSFSGVVYRKDGFIVTSSDILGEASGITVRLMDRRELEAKFVGADPKTRIAVIRVEADDLTPAEAGRIGDVRTGAIGIALGNPYGFFGAASLGHVCGEERSIHVGGRRFDRMIQLSTPIHPGDVGGIVVDSRGRLMGILHSAYRTGDDLDLSSLLRQLRGPKRGLRWEGFSFATPVDRVRFVADRIILHGKMVRGWIGVTVRERKKKGVVITALDSGGPAERAGLLRGDLLLRFGDHPVRDLSGFQDQVEGFSEPARIVVVYTRKGKERRTEVDVEIESGGK